MAQWVGAYTSVKYLTEESKKDSLRFGLRCISARQKLLLSREAFAKKVNLSEGSIKILESGRQPKLLKADKLCVQIILALYRYELTEERIKELENA